jgi:hypothetical protein
LDEAEVAFVVSYPVVGLGLFSILMLISELNGNEFIASVGLGIFWVDHRSVDVFRMIGRVIYFG